MEIESQVPEFNRVATPAMCRDADHITIEEFGIGGFTLMEIAARQAAEVIFKETGRHKSGLFLCGKGNNAGDALAAARYLAEDAGHIVNIVMAAGADSLSADTEHNLTLIKKLSVRDAGVFILDEIPEAISHSFDYIVDGLLGTGISGEIRSPYAEAIEIINGASLPVFSMDLPSGLDAETGLPMGIAVKASHTITFGMNKTGFYLNGASKYTGRVHLAPLPFPRFARKYDATLITPELRQLLPPIKRKAAHKYDDGVVHLIAGSEGLTGAAVMAAKSAWQKGAGAVVLYTTSANLPVYEKHLPQIIKVVVGSESDKGFAGKHAGTILESMKKKPGVLLAGPGMGSTDSSQELVMEILKKTEIPAVLDADALSIAPDLVDLPEARVKKILLTPHIGEAARYLNLRFDDDASRLDSAFNYSKKTGCSILMKGNPSFLIDSAGYKFITAYDTAPFTRAGFGDVLAGTIAANLGITGEVHRSAIDALLHGFEKYQKYKGDSAFGPEHLL
jgi:ADP-dependent NAD(P)H-hydrate dehydratase / NAD(P)H-hydrate epimerase